MVQPVCRTTAIAAALTAGACSVLGACGSEPASPTSSHGTAGGVTGQPAGQKVSAIKARYEAVGEGGDGDGPAILDVLVDGQRFRMEQRDGPDASHLGFVIVWDGHDLLIEEPGAGEPQRMEDPPAGERPTPFVMRAGDAAFAQMCPKGTPIGRRTVIGRRGTAYTCPAHKVADMDVDKSELTLDDATGLMLEQVGTASRMVAKEVTLGVAVEDSTFSTDLPAGAATQPPPLSHVESLPRVGGGRLVLAEVSRGPSIVVLGDLDALPGVLAELMPLTHDGTRPRTYGLLTAVPADDWKGSLLNPDDESRFVAEVSKSAGTLPVPVGVDIKGVAGEQLRSIDEVMAGTTVIAALDAQGRVALKLTQDQLADSSTELTDWIEANS